LNPLPSYLGFGGISGHFSIFLYKKRVICWMKKMKEIEDLKDIKKLLSKKKYSSEVIEEILIWYNHSEKKGVASY